MKKIHMMSSILILVLLESTFMLAGNKFDLSQGEAQISSINNQTFKKSDEQQIYKNLFVTMLYPYVNEAIDNYYKEYLSYLPGEAPYSYRIIEIKKTPGLNYSYLVVLEVMPYVGPHLTVGRDRITFRIELEGVKVEKFEHIESHKLPPYYQNIIKKQLPGT